MDNHNEHIKQYTAADIQKYLKGQLSGAEMYDMEKAALDDPFLADAMEGMGYALEQHKEEEVETGIADLRNRVTVRTTASSRIAPVRSFRWWQVAAAAAVLLVAGTGIYLFSTNTSSREVAGIVNNDTKQRAPSPQQHIPTVNNTRDSSLTTSSPVLKQKETVEERSKDVATNEKKNPPPALPEKKEQPAPSAPLYYKQADTLKNGNAVALDDKAATYRAFSKPKAIDNAKRDSIELKNMASIPAEVVKTKEGENAYATRDEVRGSGFSDMKKTGNGLLRAKKENILNQQLQGRVSGVVVDNNYNPQVNALLKIDNNKGVFNTDNRGNFSIPAGDSAVNLSVTVVGYGTQNFTLNNNTFGYQLKLQPANALQGPGFYNFQNNQQARKDTQQFDRISNYELRDKDTRYTTSYPKVMIQDAEPQYGWVSYQQYLEKNRRVFAPNTGAPAEVVVSFQVNKSGDLSNFKMVQSLSKTYDEEAIRLIKEGPSWKLLRGRKARVTIVVRF